MPHSEKKYVYDIVQAIGKIRKFTKGMDKNQFIDDEMVISAVHMQLMVIGEAVSCLRRDFPKCFEQISDGRRIVGFRNILAHSYDMVIDLVVWQVINDKLDLLENEVNNIIA